jgi:hypothetical protein
MRRGKILFRMVLAGIGLCCVQAFAQQPGIRPTGNGAEGHLTVTATVVSSVGLVVSPEGEQQIIIANAADPKDNVSRFQPAVAVKLMPVTDGDQKKPVKKTQP